MEVCFEIDRCLKTACSASQPRNDCFFSHNQETRASFASTTMWVRQRKPPMGTLQGSPAAAGTGITGDKELGNAVNSM